jgi:thiamine biosynthesis lipoprotein
MRGIDEAQDGVDVFRDREQNAMELHSCSFRCMTTEIELYLRNDDRQSALDALAAVQDFFYGVEARFSRFRADSELSQLNRASGSQVRVSPDLCELVELAVAAAEDSGGLFDPTIVGALEAAGYDRSIELIRQDQHRPTPSRVAAPSMQQSWIGSRALDIRVDRQERTVTLPGGVRLDLGGIAKGWAVDRAAAMLDTLGPGLVNAGGDLRAWGDQPGVSEAQGWLAAVDDPNRPETDVAWLWVTDSALATSSTATRRWAGGHHVIDPRTGRPVETDLVSVTVPASTVIRAEVAAKVVLILGRAAGMAWLEGQPDLEAFLVTENGQVLGTPGLEVCLAWTPQMSVV